jgi:hypothetical protein
MSNLTDTSVKRVRGAKLRTKWSHLNYFVHYTGTLNSDVYRLPRLPLSINLRLDHYLSYRLSKTGFNLEVKRFLVMLLYGTRYFTEINFLEISIEINFDF